MARKLTKLAKDEMAEPEDDQTSEPAPVDDDSTDRPTSKAAAARAALTAGVTVPKQASVWIKRKFGIDISPQQFSAEKCRLKQRSGDPNSSSLFAFSQGNRDGHYGTNQRTPISKDDLLEALEVMKPLIEQLGAEKVKRMVDLLG